eukprot:scaffold57553_cov44-Prasinocladus_malaysianus.AAC.1
MACRISDGHEKCNGSSVSFRALLFPSDKSLTTSLFKLLAAYRRGSERRRFGRAPRPATASRTGNGNRKPKVYTCFMLI